jgi:hypothetical protein
MRYVIMCAAAALFIGNKWISPAISGEMKASGTLTFVRTQFEQIPLVAGKFLDEVHLRGVLLASDPSLPLHLASQVHREMPIARELNGGLRGAHGGQAF